MIPLEKAIEIINGEIDPLSPCNVKIGDALNRVLAEDIIAGIDVPGFRTSSMDGIAIRYADLESAGPWNLPIQATSAAGGQIESSLLPAHAIKIMTGAPLIKGADTVIPIEEVGLSGETVAIRLKPDRGAFVRQVGDDIERGTTLYKSGKRIDPMDIGVLASIGASEVMVYNIPRISLLSTGNEIVEPGGVLQPGQIYNSNNQTLSALLARDGYGSPIEVASLKDDPDEIEANLKRLIEKSDLLIASGGVSVGDFDYIPSILKKLGSKILFHGVAVKPGKPVLLAEIDGKVLLGLPGNPVSALVGYHVFVRRVVFRMMNNTFEPEIVPASLGDSLEIKGDRFAYIGGKLEKHGSTYIVFPAKRQQSGRLSSMIGVNCLIGVQGGSRTFPKGKEVQAELLWGK